MLLMAVFALSGCSSMRPLASSPPVPQIVMSEPFNVAMGYKSVGFPMGEYRPVYEDKGGYYYQAPTKVVRTGVFMSEMRDGGLYIKRSNDTATKFYIIESTGQRQFGPYSVTPPKPQTHGGGTGL